MRLAMGAAQSRLKPTESTAAKSSMVSTITKSWPEMNMACAPASIMLSSKKATDQAGPHELRPHAAEPTEHGGPHHGQRDEPAATTRPTQKHRDSW